MIAMALASATWLTGASRWAVLSASERGFLFSAGVGLMILGLFLQWRLPEYHTTAEERAKDRQLSEEQARRRIMIFRYSVPTVILSGLVLFIVVFFN